MICPDFFGREVSAIVTYQVTSPYWPLVIEQVSRLLSMQDREFASRTFGCFDRAFWGWKFTDFPCARFQEGACALAMLYTQQSSENSYVGQPRLQEWAFAALDFWCRIQHRDGSFDEAYPRERSLAAVAFTTFYLGEAYLRLERELPTALRDRLQETFYRAGAWLFRNEERHGILSNHLAAAAAAVHHAGTIAEAPTYLDRRDQLLAIIYRHQSSEGWFEEYGGADPGYQTHGMFYLTRLWQLTGDEKLLERLRLGAAFLTRLIHPDGTLGGEYGSRNTEFFFPAAFEMLAAVCDDARAIATYMRSSVAKGQSVGLRTVDPYNFCPMLNNYLYAAASSRPLAASETLACQQEGLWNLCEAGLVVKSTASYFAVLGLGKGGVLKVWDKSNRQLILSDCGYIGLTENGRLITSQWLERGARPLEEAVTWVIDRPFMLVPRKVFSPGLFVAFRIIGTLAGMLQSAATTLKRILVWTLIYCRREGPIHLRRTVILGDETIEVQDELWMTGKRAVALRWLRRGRKFTAHHMGSARYFLPSELVAAAGDGPDIAAELFVTGRLVCTYQITPGVRKCMS